MWGRALSVLYALLAVADLRRLARDWKSRRLDEEARHYRHRQVVLADWGKAIDLFEMLICHTDEVLQEAAESTALSSQPYLEEVLLDLLGRALRTARETVWLCRGGLPDGANARSRTLYELRVMADFLGSNGDDAAVAYINHRCVDQYKRLEQELDAGNTVDPQFRKKIEEHYYACIEDYRDNKHFKEPLGWAYPFLDDPKGRVTVAKLAKAVDGKREPSYKESSFQVHADRAGLFGLSAGPAAVVPVGYSNFGLHVPLGNSANALMFSVFTVVLARDEIESRDVRRMKVFERQTRKLHRELRKAERRIEAAPLVERGETGETVGIP